MNAVRRGLCAGWVALWALGCSGISEVERTDLTGAVARDGVAFAGDEIPAEVVSRLASHRLVIVGETHHLMEHAEFMGGLLRALHQEGFRQLLMEWPQAADWLLDDFVMDGGLEPDWKPPPPLNGHLIERIRDFNATLPEGERISVRGIDVNLADYGGADSFRDLIGTYVGHLGDAGPVGPFLGSAYGTPDEQERALASLRAELTAREAELSERWGPIGYANVAEMVEVEVASIGVRARREDHYDLSARLRESVLKRLVDMRLEGYPHGTVLNVGANHAQKEHLKGTSQEWLGDYLVHASMAIGGSAFVAAVVPARTIAPEGDGPGFDLRQASPENELFRVMSEAWPGATVFLPLDDPLFSSGGVVTNFEGLLYVCAPKQHYDALLLYPEAHRIPVAESRQP